MITTRTGNPHSSRQPALDMLRQLHQETNQFYQNFTPLKQLTQAIENHPCLTSSAIFTLADTYLSWPNLQKLLTYEQQKYTAHPYYTSPVIALNTGAITGWVLKNHPKFQIILLAFSAVPFRAQQAANKMRETLSFTASDLYLRLLQSDGFTCSHWQAPLVDDKNPAHTKLKCKKMHTTTWRTGDRLFCQGGTQTIRYENVTSTTIALQVYSRINRTNVMANYDPATLTLKSLTVADQQASRLQNLSTIMRLFNRQDALPTLTSLLDHPDHFVRWHTAREITALAPKKATPLLKTLARTDPSPMVRQCAQQTLKKFYPHASYAPAP